MSAPAFRSLSSTKAPIRRVVAEWSFNGFVTRARFACFREAWNVNDLVQDAYERGKSDGRAEMMTRVEDAMLNGPRYIQRKGASHG